jgi:hypothetical protein
LKEAGASDQYSQAEPRNKSRQAIGDWCKI